MLFKMRLIVVTSRFLAFFSLFLFAGPLWALEVDEKLTLRVLSVSDSKKTVLINRGQEDGLAQGDHAKFFLTTGVVARGVVVKLSPTRSIWSLYRLVDPDNIKPDWVMNLKITKEVTITKDPSKMIIDEPRANVSTDLAAGIPLADGADDVDHSLDQKAQADLAFLQQDTARVSDISSRFVEINLGLGLGTFSSSLANNSQSEDTTTAVNGSNSSIELIAGLEIYPRNVHAWYGAFSFMPLLRYESQKILAGDGQSLSRDITEYGLRLSWYPFRKRTHNLTDTFIPFASAAGGMGKVLDSYTITTSAAGEQIFENTGSLVFWEVGGGFKYFLSNGFGLKTEVSYLARSTTYQILTTDAAEEITWTDASAGVKISTSFAYRF